MSNIPEDTFPRVELGPVVGGRSKPLSDTQLLDWIENNPGRVLHAKGYHGSRDSWGWTERGDWREAKSLRHAVLAAIASYEKQTGP